MGPGYYGWGGMWGFPWMIFVFLAVVAACFFLCQGRYPRGDRTKETPLEIIKKRYAKGEISREQFEEMKKDLQ